eukprot:1369469-Rhodomonas_salina.1
MARPITGSAVFNVTHHPIETIRLLDEFHFAHFVKRRSKSSVVERDNPCNIPVVSMKTCLAPALHSAAGLAARNLSPVPLSNVATERGVSILTQWRSFEGLGSALDRQFGFFALSFFFGIPPRMLFKEGWMGTKSHRTQTSAMDWDVIKQFLTGGQGSDISRLQTARRKTVDLSDCRENNQIQCIRRLSREVLEAVKEGNTSLFLPAPVHGDGKLRSWTHSFAGLSRRCKESPLAFLRATMVATSVPHEFGKGSHLSSTVMVAIHIRRGDILANKWSSRLQPHEKFLKAAQAVLNAVNQDPLLRFQAIHFHIFSESPCCNFYDEGKCGIKCGTLVDELQRERNFTADFTDLMSRTHAPFKTPWKVVQHIDESAAKAFVSFSVADILIASASQFSLFPAQINTGVQVHLPRGANNHRQRGRKPAATDLRTIPKLMHAYLDAR